MKRSGLGVVLGYALATALGAAPAATQDTVPGMPALAPLTVVDTVTLEEAAARALDVNPQVVQAATSLSTAQSAMLQSYASMLPTLSLSSGALASSSERYDPQTNLRVSGQSSSYSAGLSSSMDLFAGGRNLAQVRSSRASETAAEANLRASRFEVALSATTAFFAVLRAEDLIELTTKQIEQANTQLSAAQHRLQAGRATRSDVLRAQLQVRNAQQALLQAETQRRTAMYVLGRTVGVTGAVAAERPPTLEPQPLALNGVQMRELVLGEAPSVLSARANLNVAEAGLSQAQAQWLPTVGLSGGYTWANSEAALLGGRTSWSTSLRLSYPVFNGLSREVAIDRANAQVTLARAQAEDASRAAVTEVERLLASVQLAEQQLALLQESVSVAREDYRVQKERYDLGAGTILDLVSSQIALSQAENDLINARYDYLLAKAELESLVGRTL